MMRSTARAEATSAVSRWRVALLVGIPVVVFGVCALATLMFVAWARLMSAMGHGHLSDSEAGPLWAGGWAVAIATTAIAVVLVERGMLGRASGRTDAQRTVMLRTRIATAVLSLMQPFVVPPVARAIYQHQEMAQARHGTEADRDQAIQELGQRGTPAAYRALRDIAFNRAEDPYIRSRAAYQLAEYPEGKESLLTLAGDAPPAMLGTVGAGLLLFADDPRAWAVVERLARDERASVREPMQEALRYGRMQQGAVAKRTRLLEAIAASGSTPDALAAAGELGTGGFDRAIAMLTDASNDDATRLEAAAVLGKIRDPRAIGPLLDVVVGRAAPGIVPPANEDAYRRQAAEAIAKIQGYAPAEDLLTPYNLEQQAAREAREVVKAQAAYAQATGFYDARLSCLEMPATCLTGRDPDETFLAPSLTRDTRHGYVHRLQPGPPAAADEIAVRRASASSLRAFAYVSVPQVPGGTGIRAFCADESGDMCFTRDGRPPLVRGGRCVMQPAPGAVTPAAYDAIIRVCEVGR